MFRLFRRRKKDKKKEKTIEEEVDTKSDIITPAAEISQETQEESQMQSIEVYTTTETPFEEQFATLPKVISEPIPEEPAILEPILDFLPFAGAIVESEVSINSFISPELLKAQLPVQTKLDTAIIAPIKLVPISLEERIEGALFSIGRPIHADELIESLQEESPLVKRTIRKLSRQRKRTSPIVIEEISRDRWVLQLNPIYHEFFHEFFPEKFMTEEERRVITEIAYRQPISLALVKKIIRGIGPVKITEICRDLENRGYVIGEDRARSTSYTTTPKFANDFGFDDESRRLKLQMLWRLKRLMGDVEEEEEEEEIEEAEDKGENEAEKKPAEEITVDKESVEEIKTESEEFESPEEFEVGVEPAEDESPQEPEKGDVETVDDEPTESEESKVELNVNINDLKKFDNTESTLPKTVPDFVLPEEE
ncbi:MAG: SMC-Scp complex subunit ScpB [Promethearchaeota archaeon]